MGALRALHRADTVLQGVGITLQATSTRGDAMLRRVFQQFVHGVGNGRAVENARRDLHHDRFVHERIEAVVKRLGEPASASASASARKGRGAA
jgi:hypothetical protein